MSKLSEALQRAKTPIGQKFVDRDGRRWEVEGYWENPSVRLRALDGPPDTRMHAVDGCRMAHELTPAPEKGKAA